MSFLSLTWKNRAAAIMMLAAGAAGRSAPQDLQALAQRRLSSPLYGEAAAAGGRIDSIGVVAAADLYPDLRSLMAASDEVRLVNVVSNSVQLSPSGNSVFTSYTAQVLRTWKGGGGLQTLYLSVPIGTLIFDPATKVRRSWRNFRPLVPGGRYVVFMRYPRGDEAQSTPGLRLAGGGVQGAFALDDRERAWPMFTGDAIAPSFTNVSTAAFMSQLDALAAPLKQQ